MPARSTAARYDPKWYAAADTSGCIRRVIALYDRSFFCLWSFLIAWRISFLSQTMRCDHLKRWTTFGLDPSDAADGHSSRGRGGNAGAKLLCVVDSLNTQKLPGRHGGAARGHGRDHQP